MNRINKFFSHQDLINIEQAVKDAEKQVSGEIVPVFIEQSDNYPEAALRAGILSIMMTAVAILLIDEGLGWKQFVLLRNEWVFLGSILFGGVIGALATIYITPIKRWMIGTRRMDEHVDAMAKQLFLEHRLFETSNRTGILILVSLFEREVEILGDKGINEKINPEQWLNIVNEMTDLLAKRKNFDAILTGIHMCRDLLINNHFIANGENPNELSDHLRPASR